LTLLPRREKSKRSALQLSRRRRKPKRRPRRREKRLRRPQRLQKLRSKKRVMVRPLPKVREQVMATPREQRPRMVLPPTTRSLPSRMLSHQSLLRVLGDVQLDRVLPLLRVVMIFLAAPEVVVVGEVAAAVADTTRRAVEVGKSRMADLPLTSLLQHLLLSRSLLLPLKRMAGALSRSQRRATVVPHELSPPKY
jgi:hypothetical protein